MRPLLCLPASFRGGGTSSIFLAGCPGAVLPLFTVCPRGLWGALADIAWEEEKGVRACTGLAVRQSGLRGAPGQRGGVSTRADSCVHIYLPSAKHQLGTGALLDKDWIPALKQLPVLQTTGI